MTIQLKNKIKTYIDVSYDNKATWYRYNADVIKDNKIKIDRTKCDSLNKIFIRSSSGVIIKPKIEDDSLHFYFNIETENTKYVSLDDLLVYLRRRESNTPENPIELHVYNLQKNLEKLNEIILNCKKYVDISYSILRHNTTSNDFTSSWNNVEDYNISDIKLISAFPAVFKNNPYICGITIPIMDNYSEPNVLTKCDNLRNILFENLKDWKVENGLKYFDMSRNKKDGIEKVEKSEFILQLINPTDSNSYLIGQGDMW